MRHFTKPLTENDYREVINGILSSTPFMEPLPKELYEGIVKSVNNSISTDIVQAGPTELFNFAHFWKGMGHYDEQVDKMYIPCDIIVEGTVPIMDMIIMMSSSDDNVEEASIENSVRIVIFEEALRKILSGEFVDPMDSAIVGAIIMTQCQIVFPMVVGHDAGDGIQFMPNAACLEYSYAEYSKVPGQISDYIKETIMMIAGIVVPAWYGMQLALLHPATKMVFDNPIREKRDRKAQLKPIVVNGRLKKVKYVRRHIIHTGQGVYNALEESMNTMYGKDSEEKRKYNRHTYIWRVIGHSRVVNGKETWVKPYWKGPLKNFAGQIGVTPNHREIERINENGGNKY